VINIEMLLLLLFILIHVLLLLLPFGALPLELVDGLAREGAVGRDSRLLGFCGILGVPGDVAAVCVGAEKLLPVTVPRQ
jgi:hypothetical protein